ncbi:MAG: methyltransferase domain-containing protein [Pseudomonadota bacterium]
MGDDVRDYTFGTEFTASLYTTVYHQVLKQFDDHRFVRELHDRFMPEGTVFQKPLILDVGAGTGLLSMQLLQADKNRRLMLLEPSPAMSTMSTTEELITEDMLSSASAQDLYDTEGEPFQDESIDGVVTNNMIYLLSREEIRQLFAEIARVLKPGGRFSVSSMRNAPREKHEEFLEYAKQSVRQMEVEGTVPLGAAQILYGSNQNIIQQEPTMLSFEEVEAMAIEFGLQRISDYETIYQGAGFFLAFEKPE